MATGLQTARWTRAKAGARAAACVLLLCGGSAHASFLEGEALDSMADAVSWAVLIVAPVVGIVVFWLLHIIPEKIAEKRHHPQAKAIQALCLLSLVFGGLLWPVAMLWALTRPVLHKAAYGYDRIRHGEEPEHHFAPEPALAVQPQAALAPSDELQRLRAQIDSFAAAGAPPTPEQLQDLRARLAAIEAATPPTLST